MTVVTCGLSLDELRSRYGEALPRRILEAGGTGKLVNLFGAAPAAARTEARKREHASA